MVLLYNTNKITVYTQELSISIHLIAKVKIKNCKNQTFIQKCVCVHVKNVLYVFKKNLCAIIFPPFYIRPVKSIHNAFNEMELIFLIRNNFEHFY